MLKLDLLQKLLILLLPIMQKLIFDQPQLYRSLVYDFYDHPLTCRDLDPPVQVVVFVHLEQLEQYVLTHELDLGIERDLPVKLFPHFLKVFLHQLRVLYQIVRLLFRLLHLK